MIIFNLEDNNRELNTFVDLIENATQGTHTVNYTLGNDEETTCIDKKIRLDNELYAKLLLYFKDRFYINSAYAFDIETYPNFFSLVAINAHDESEVLKWYIHDTHSDRKYLEDFLRNPLTLIGYNSLNYDDIMIKGIIQKYDLSELFELSSSIINYRSLSNEQKNHFNQFKHDAPYFHNSIDLMLINNLHRFGVSLKQVGIALKCELLQDLPYSPSTMITADDIPKMIDYNVNDVIVTLRLYHHTFPSIVTRDYITNLFGKDVMNKSDSSIGVSILKMYYENEVGKEVAKLMYARKNSDTEAVDLANCIPPNLNLKSTALNQLVTELKNTILVSDPRTYKFSLTNVTLKNHHAHKYIKGRYKKSRIAVNNTWYDFGLGGLHSVDKPAIFETCNEYEIIDADVASFYPQIILNVGIYPSHLGHEMLTAYLNILMERLEAKSISKDTNYSEEERQKADYLQAVLKIALNSVFGHFNFFYSDFYDPQSAYRVTIAGQLYLLDLIEKMEIAGIQVISANTDGITCKVHKSKKQAYEAICKEWQNRTKFILEFVTYKKYARRDVNNYLAIPDYYDSNPDDIKVKGVFDNSISITGGYRYPIVSTALKEYFVNGVSVEDTIMGCDNIHPFLLSEKMNRKFKLIYKTFDDTIEMQKTCRFIVSKKGGMLVKIDHDGKEIKRLTSGKANIPLNNIQHSGIDHYIDMIDYRWYINQSQKIIDIVENNNAQMSLF